MTAALLGGQLVQRLEPTTALHSAAALVTCTPLLVIFGTLFLIPENKAPVNIQGMRHTLDGLLGDLLHLFQIHDRTIVSFASLRARSRCAALFSSLSAIFV